MSDTANAPLKDLDHWEEFLKTRYPEEEGKSAFTDPEKKKEEFRNYEADARGCWYFQNGPQRVYVTLAYTPFVVRHEGARLLDQCGREVLPRRTYLDDEDSVLVLGQHGICLLDDRDLERYAEGADALARIERSNVAARFGFVADPSPPP